MLAKLARALMAWLYQYQHERAQRQIFNHMRKDPHCKLKMK